MIELAAAARPGRSLISLARPHLAELTRLTGEAAGHLHPRRHATCSTSTSSPPTASCRCATGPATASRCTPCRPARWCSPTTREPLERVLRQARCSVHAAHHRRRSATAASGWQLVRRDGYAWALEEFADGLNSVAAAVRNADGRVVAALHVYGPASRFPGDRDAARAGRARASPPPTRSASTDPRISRRSRHARGSLRLHHRRRRLGRLGAGQPAQRRPGEPGAGARGRPPRLQVGRLHPHAGRADVPDRQPLLRLEVRERTRAVHERPAGVPRPRQGAGRLAAASTA